MQLNIGSPDVPEYFELPSMAALTGFTWFIVQKILPSVLEVGGHILGTASGPGNEVAEGFAGSTYNIDYGSNTLRPFTSTLVDVEQWHVSHGHSKPNDWAYCQNGNVIDTDSSNTVSLPGTPRIGHNNQATDRFRSNIAAAYFFSDKLTPEQDAIVKEYITDKWGITFA